MAWVALVPLLVAIHDRGVREAALLGAVTGTVTNYLAFRWCLELMANFSNLGPAAYLVMLAMAAYQCLPWALWCGFLRAPTRVGRRLNGWLGLALGTSLFVSMEYFYPIVFPWYLANTQHSRPEVVSSVELGGVSLLSLLLVLCGLLLASLFTPRSESSDGSPIWPLSPDCSKPRLAIAAALVLLLPWLVHPLLKTRVEEAMTKAPRLAVGLVQPNEWIGSPSTEGLHAYQQMTQKLVQECQAAGLSLDLVMWPESALRTPPGRIERRSRPDAAPLAVHPGTLARYPLDVSRILPSFGAPTPSVAEETAVPREELLAPQRGYAVPILFGATLEDVRPEAQGPIPGRPALYNCAVLIDQGGYVLGAVKKVKLLIFGESIPGSAWFPQVYRLLPAASALLSGKEAEVVSLGQARLGIMICYEDLLPWFHHELAQKSPQILLNLTNDAWFGRTAEPACHLALSTLRAVEGRCYLIRSTPTGVSAVVDPWGQVVASIPTDQAGTLRYEVALLDIPTLFERWGDWVAWTCLGLMLVLAAAAWGRRRES